MDFGVVMQNDPPAWRVVDLAVRAETYGFTHACSLRTAAALYQGKRL